MRDPYILFEKGPNREAAVFSAPSDVIVAWSPEEIPMAFERLKAAQKDGAWLAGYASYELGYVLEPKLETLLPPDRKTPLLCFGVFDGPSRAQTHTMAYAGKSTQDRARLTQPKPVWSPDDYDDAFQRVLEYIRAGDIYQANLTFPMRATYEGDVLGLASALDRVQPVGYGAVVALGEGPQIVSRSPELFFQTDETGCIETRPMKGTAPRGKTLGEDADLAEFLRNDPKNRAENLMIVDLLRNDISRVSKIGSVRVPELFTVERYKTVHQMTSLVQAQLRDDVTLVDLLKALFPCGSITGAPKVRAMEIIRELEPEARDIYCGSIGWMAPDGSSCFNVAIRTLTLFDDGVAHLNVGGGVVYDSTSGSEYEEALWKARYTKLLPPVFS